MLPGLANRLKTFRNAKNETFVPKELILDPKWGHFDQKSEFYEIRFIVNTWVFYGVRNRLKTFRNAKNDNFAPKGSKLKKFSFSLYKL